MRRLTLILFAIAVGISGCAKDRGIDLRGDGFEPDATLDQQVRPSQGAAKNSSQRTGFSTKAQEIESRLGVD